MSTPAVLASLPFTENEIETMIVDAVSKFFETMVSEDIKHKDTICFSSAEKKGQSQPVPIPMPSEKPIVAAAVGFIGTVNGVIYLYFHEDLANKVACGFLGLDLEEVLEEGHETVNDVMGEVANMTVGTFKNQMCDKGYNCRLTIPSILRGQHFSIENTSSVLRKVYRFDCFDTAFAADLIMKPGE